MESIEINVPEKKSIDDFIIIYKGQEERKEDQGKIIEIKTSKEELSQKLGYFKDKLNELKHVNEMIIRDSYPADIFRAFIKSATTRKIEINEANYSMIYDLCRKYGYPELELEILKFTNTRPDLKKIVNGYSDKFNDYDKTSQSNILTESISEEDIIKEDIISRHLDICLLNESMLKYPICVLNRILNSPNRVIEDHHLLFNFVKKIIEIRKPQKLNTAIENYEVLIGSLDLTKMSNDDLNEFLSSESFSSAVMASHSKEKLKTMNDEKRELTRLYNEQEARLSKLEEVLSEHVKNTNSMNEKLNEFESERKQLKATISRQEERIGNLERQLDEFKVQQGAMNAKFEEQENLKRTVSELRVSMNQHEDKLRILDEKKEDKNSEQLKATISRQEERIGDLERQLNEFKVRQCAMNAKLEEQENLKRTVSELRVSMNQHEDKLRILDEKKKDKNNVIKFDSVNRFKGIIYELGNGNPEKVVNEGIIGITSSPCINNSYWDPKFVFNFSNDEKGFHSQNNPNSWLCYDFKERKVKLSNYSLKSHGHGGRNNNRVQTWVIEGSKDGNKWNEIDSRHNEQSVCDNRASNTFAIRETRESNEFYRYIRIKQTDVNTSGGNCLVISVLEFFGTVLEP